MAEIDPETLKESETVERKEELNSNALKTISAFANTKGGSLYVGIKDDATLLTGEISDQAQQDVVNKVVNKLGIIPDVSLHTFEGQEFLEIRIKKSRRPISYNGKYYQRSGNTTRELDTESLKTLFLNGVSWDTQLDDRFSVDDINEQTWTRFDADSRGQRGIPEWDSMEMAQLLQHLSLMVDGRLTNAAIMLFGKDPQKYFPHTTIRVGRFKDQSTIISDNIISGNLYDQLGKVEQVIKSLINKRYEITGESLKRKEVWDYPLPAIREALLNAIVHRNYLITSSEIEIKIFDDSIWFYNPGKLPEGLTIDQLKHSHSSIRRNRLIADVFFRAGYIEQFGSGTLRMMEALKSESHPEPEFKEQANGFVTQFFIKQTIAIQPEKVEGLNERQKAALVYIREHGKIDTATYQKMSDVSRVTAFRDLKKLIDKGLIKQIGKEGPGTYYILD